MNNLNQDILAYLEAAQTIRNAIVHGRYRTAANANADMLSLYYGVGKYISINTRSGKWGTGAIDVISEQLQGELPGLHGFSSTNMKNMRIFFEQWSPELEPNRQLPTADLNSNDGFPLIRQLLTAELEEAKISLCSSYSCTFVLNANGEIFYWKRDLSLYNSDAPSDISFERIQIDKKIVSIYASAYHLLALSDDGEVYILIFICHETSPQEAINKSQTF